MENKSKYMLIVKPKQGFDNIIEMTTQLKKFRNKIDKIDNEIVNLLKKRLKVVKSLGKYKKKNKIKIKNENREKEVILKVKNRAKNPLEKNYLTAIFESIILNSRKMQ